ncbi:hypothetical protein [Hymenobacter wooponensis]|uniref:Lipocalin-like domain-containing protein n=1 Tax=Hymenobacter wooponensis TaxID=1525360 RepID=A0A4Z0MJC8_9BACT|nr:hypothetical protein [Hymenobacter wooponensis]TGD79873.1 hypothetical protein EU557_16820 [Hymenobacter wooponensis]
MEAIRSGLLSSKRLRTLLPHLAVGLLLSASGCGGEPEPTGIFGEWQWISSVGGLTGKDVLTPAIVGAQRTLSFTRDSMFVQCDADQCSVPTKFILRQERSWLDAQQHLILTVRRRLYLAAPDTGFVVLVNRYRVSEVSGTLRIDQERPDGYVETYYRK